MAQSAAGARRRAQEQAQASSRLAAQRAAVAAMFALPRAPAMRCHTARLHHCPPGDPLDRVRRCVLHALRMSHCSRPHEIKCLLFNKSAAVHT